MAFDFGTQRIGVAYGQSLSGTAKAVAIIAAKDGIPNWQEIEDLIHEWQPELFVIGMPFNLDGSASEILPRAKKFANRLHGRFGKPCYGMDERLSSRAATERVHIDQQGFAGEGIRSGAGKAGRIKKAAIDHIAAQIILENWFNELNQGLKHP